MDSLEGDAEREVLHTITNSTNFTDFTTFSFNNIYLETVQWHQWKNHKTPTHLDGLACMTAIVGEDGRHRLEDFASVSPGHHQAEEAGTGQCCEGLTSGVVHSCAPHGGLQQKMKERLCGANNGAMIKLYRL